MVARLSSRNSRKAYFPPAASLAPITGGSELPFSVGRVESGAEKSSTSMLSVTAPIFRLPTYSSRALLAFQLPNLRPLASLPGRIAAATAAFKSTPMPNFINKSGGAARSLTAPAGGAM